MKHIDTLIVGRNRGGLTVAQLEEFVRMQRPVDSVLRYSHDNITANESVYHVYLRADLWQGPDLEIDGNIRWDVVDFNPHLRRRRNLNPETVNQWKERIDSWIKSQGYWVNDDGYAHWVRLTANVTEFSAESDHPPRGQVLIDGRKHYVYFEPFYNAKETENV
jgi:hypothetical protein